MNRLTRYWLNTNWNIPKAKRKNARNKSDLISSKN